MGGSRSDGRLGDAAPVTFDELAALLRLRRAECGHPSFSEITRRVSALRADRGVGASERTPGRVTVYDCFRDGRRRLDAQLVLDIVAALGGAPSEIATWRTWCRALQFVPEDAPPIAAHRELPQPAQAFIGRRAELERLRGERCACVTEMAGVGKTQLARQSLRERIAAGEVSGAIALDVGASASGWQPVEEAAILAAAARALRLTRESASGLLDSNDAGRGIIAAVLRRRRLALLIDDIADPAPLAGLLAELSSPVVLTSRLSARVPRELAHLELTVWKAEESIAMLADHIGSARVRREPRAARSIMDRSGGLPLAAERMALRVSEKPDWSLADHDEAFRLRAEAGRLDRTVNESFSLSYSGLDVEARRALRLLAVQPALALAPKAFRALIGLGAEEARVIERTLVRSHTAVRSPDGRIGLHPLMRVFAATLSRDEDTQRDRDRAFARLARSLIADAQDPRPAAAIAAPAAADGSAASSAAAGTAPADSRLAAGSEPACPDAARSTEDAVAWLLTELAGVTEVVALLAERRPEFFEEVAQVLRTFILRQHLMRLGSRSQRPGLSAADLLSADLAEIEGVLSSAHALFGQVLTRIRQAALDGSAARPAQSGANGGRPGSGSRRARVQGRIEVPPIGRARSSEETS